MDSKSAIPIAKIVDSDKIVFLLPESDVFQEIPKKNLAKHTFKCPYCKEVLKSKQSLIHHITKSCPKKKSIATHTKPSIKMPIGEKLMKLPLEAHEVIIVTGAPGCGKSYWTNELVKLYKTIFERDVYLITRLTNDETLKEDNFIKINVDNAVLEDPFKLEDFENSLVIFDDVESSECPKATNAMYDLMSDLCKNGRHINNSVIFVNQESRMGKKTKPILSCITGVVIFPKGCSLYQTEKLLKEHIGLSHNEISEILKINSRWIYLSRSVPQYIIHENGVYMLGKEIYD